MNEMENWALIDGKEVITPEYARHLFQLGEQCNDKDDLQTLISKHGECYSIVNALRGGYYKARGKWTTDFSTEEKTWRRFGNVRYDENYRDFVPSFNHADQRLEYGVSVMDGDWENTVSAGFFSGDLYELKGIQVAWGSDGEPLIVPTSIPKKV